MQTGADARWEALLAERDRAVRVARARCADRGDVDDVVQEAMARVAAMPEVDLARVGPLLTAVVSNLAADASRGRARRARVAAKAAGQAQDVHPHDEEVCDLSEARWLWGRRLALPDQDRRVLELRAQGHSVGSAAAELGITYKAAESAFTRARGRLLAVWRATAAAVGALCLPFRGRQAAPAAGAALASAAVVLALGWGPPPPVPPSAPPGAPPGGAQPAAAGAAGAPDRSTAGTARPGVPLRPASPLPRTAPSAPAVEAGGTQPRTVAGAPPLQVGEVRTDGGTRIERTHGEESAAQTVRRCLSDGVTLTVREIGCNDDGRP